MTHSLTELFLFVKSAAGIDPADESADPNAGIVPEVFPTHALPPMARAMVEDLAQVHQSDPAIPAAAAIGALASRVASESWPT